MVLAIFPQPTDGVTIMRKPRRRRSKVLTIARFPQAQQEQRISWGDRGFDRVSLAIQMTPAGQDFLETFLEDHGFGATTFLLEDPFRNSRIGIVLDGVTDSANKTFTLPNTGAAAGDYTVAAIFATLYDDGVPVAITSINRDARSLEATAAPAASSVMKLDHSRFLKRYRFVPGSEPDYTFRTIDLAEATVELLEVAA